MFFERALTQEESEAYYDIVCRKAISEILSGERRAMGSPEVEPAASRLLISRRFAVDVPLVEPVSLFYHDAREELIDPEE